VVISAFKGFSILIFKWIVVYVGGITAFMAAMVGFFPDFPLHPPVSTNGK
jgi:hypothetical protein